MVSLLPESETPRQRAARRAALARWNGRRILRLDELSPENRRIILALVELGESSGAEAVPDAA